MGAINQQAIRRRANDRCEYCGIPQSALKLPFVVDHIIARQHGGKTELSNLALCCGHCNLRKGPNIAGIDPASHKLVRLFNPRQDRWHRHFRRRRALIIGSTSIGRTTTQVLAMNHPVQIALRLALEM